MMKRSTCTAILLTLLVLGCGGQDGGPSPSADVQSMRDLLAIYEAQNQRLRERIDQAERQATETEPEEEEVFEQIPIGMTEDWVWHDGRFVPISQVPVEEPQPQAPEGHVYTNWRDHDSPELHDLTDWIVDGPRVELTHVTFGIIDAQRGAYTPWMRGELPENSLYVNNNHVRAKFDEFGYLTVEYSDVRWRGSFVGLTPAGRSVTGNVTLSDFDFSGTNHRGSMRWDPGKAYLALTDMVHEDGTTWGDGDLEYEVGIGKTFSGNTRLHDNSFSHPFRKFDCSRHPSGCNDDSLSIAAGVRDEGYATDDAGQVRGMLFGANHEAMAGTLQRHDLDVAFGGTR